MGLYPKELVLLRDSIRSLQIDCSRGPIEIQLSWLFELLMIRTVAGNLNKIGALVKPDKSGDVRLVEKNCYKGYPFEYMRCIETLRNYRDVFVHHGYSQALAYFYELVEMKEDLCKVASMVNVQLDFDNRLYK